MSVPLYNHGRLSYLYLSRRDNISPCYSLELCIQMDISFLFSFAFHFSSLKSQLFVRSPQTTILPLCISFYWVSSRSLPPVQCHEAWSIVLQALCLSDIIPWTYCQSHCIILRDLILVIPECFSGFPYIFQFKSEFCIKEFQMFQLQYKRLRNQRSKYQYPLDHRKSKRVSEKHLLQLYWQCQRMVKLLPHKCTHLTH